MDTACGGPAGTQSARPGGTTEPSAPVGTRMNAVRGVEQPRPRGLHQPVAWPPGWSRAEAASGRSTRSCGIDGRRRRAGAAAPLAGARDRERPDIAIRPV